MNINTCIALLDWEGNVLTKKHFGVNSDNPANLGFVLATALGTPYPDEKNVSQEEKFQRYELALKIRGNEEVELSAEEVVLLKKLVAKLSTVLIYGQVASILEGKDTGIEQVRPNTSDEEEN